MPRLKVQCRSAGEANLSERRVTASLRIPPRPKAGKTGRCSDWLTAITWPNGCRACGSLSLPTTRQRSPGLKHWPKPRKAKPSICSLSNPVTTATYRLLATAFARGSTLRPRLSGHRDKSANRRLCVANGVVTVLKERFLARIAAQFGAARECYQGSVGIGFGAL
jgi:hypothetical protein